MTKYTVKRLVLLTPELYAAVQAQAEREGRRAANWMRYAIERQLREDAARCGYEPVETAKGGGDPDRASE